MKFKYYSNNSSSIDFFVNEIEKYLDEEDTKNKEINCISDCLEIYNLLKYRKCANKIDKKYDDILEILKGKVFSYFSNLVEFEHLKDVKASDINDYLELYIETKKYKKSKLEDYPEQFIINNLKQICKYEVLIKSNNSYLSTLLNSSNISGELVLEKYYIKGRKEDFEYYFPKAFDKESAIERYVDTDNPNINYLQIFTSSRCTELNINAELKLKAAKRIRKYFEENKDYLKNIGFEVYVNFDLESNDVSGKINGNKSIVTYGLKNVLENIDSKELLLIDTFCNLFNFIDDNGRIKMFDDSSETSFIGEHFLTKALNGYEMGFNVRYMEMLYIQIIEKYNEFLISNGDLNIELLIKWYFKEYLKSVFKIEGFEFQESLSSNYAEKNRNILCELDSILKQFGLLENYVEIDWLLMTFDEETINFESVPSLIKEKYLYVEDEKITNQSNVLFSKGNMLSYILSSNIEEDCLFNLIKKHEIHLNDFEDYQIPYIVSLINDGIVNNQDHLTLTNKANTLYEIYSKNAIVNGTDHYDKLIEYNHFVSNCMFTKNEIAYLNFTLNNKEFSNNIGLRNKYIHGLNTRNEDIQKNHYYHILMIFVVVLLKINDEIVKYYKPKQNNNTI